MVNNILKSLFALILILVFPNISKSQDLSFEAYIDRENVAVGEGFQIKLELINAQPASAPDLSVLPSEIQVLSSQQQQQVTYINNIQAVNVSWILDLVANKEGALKIPSIEIKTNVGSLYTKPFKIFVKSANQLSATTSDNSVFIDVQVDKKEIFIDEPLIYKSYVYYFNDINQEELVKPKSENAVIEQIGEVKKSRQMLNGVNYKVIEVQYIVTPSKEGVVEIEPTILRGKTAKIVNNPQPNMPLDDIFSSFSQQNTVANAMMEYVPFTVASNKISLNVKPAVAGINPWLAIYGMQIDEEVLGTKLDEQTNKIKADLGEPITRKIRISVYGKGAEALPEIDTMFASNSDFKIYADKPENNKELLDSDQDLANRIKGIRTQTFTFIPQKSGQLILPELNISFWNLKDNKLDKAVLSGKIIEVEGSNLVQNQKSTENLIDKNANNQNNSISQGLEDNSKANKENDESYNKTNTDLTLQDKITNDVNLKTKLKEVFNSPQMPNLVILVVSFFICIIMFITFKIIATGGKKDFFKDENKPNHVDDQLVSKRLKLIQSENHSVKKDNKKLGLSPRKIINFSNKNNDNGVNNFANAIKSSRNFGEVLANLQKFGAKYLNLSMNSAAGIIANNIYLKYGVEKTIILKIAADLDAALYASKDIDFDNLKNSLAIIIARIESSSSNNNNEGLVALNP
jgi:hypothetical protein